MDDDHVTFRWPPIWPTGTELEDWMIKRPSTCDAHDFCKHCMRTEDGGCGLVDEIMSVVMKQIENWPRPSGGWTDEEVEKIKARARHARHY